MTKTTKILIGAGSGLAAIAIAAALYWFGISRPIDLSQPVEMTIETGASSAAIARQAEQAGLVRSARAFQYYADFKGVNKKFKAGHFVFSGQASFASVAEVLIAGDKTSNVTKITIPEGWTSKDIDSYLAKNGKFAQGEFLAWTKDPALNERMKAKYPFLAGKPASSGLEGFLFPDTYSVYNNATVNEIVEKMLSNFDRKLKPEWRQEIDRQGKTLFQIITMASIIEKEVRKTDDMKMVSDIFWRRIRNGQRLESCATLAYVLGVNKPQYSLEDTEIDSPYNTYANKGLPPGPISNPGANAIEAAIYPQANNFNFFLTANGTGETVYSATFEEHVRNKNKYLK
jgi:UPF0755 protein